MTCRHESGKYVGKHTQERSERELLHVVLPRVGKLVLIWHERFTYYLVHRPVLVTTLHVSVLRAYVLELNFSSRSRGSIPLKQPKQLVNL